MNQSNSSKQVLLSVIGVAILVVAVVGVSFAFFNYTRTGEANTVRTGTIFFNTSESKIEVENLFPVAKATATGYDVSTDSFVGVAVVTIDGYTTYANGVDYVVTAENVNFDTSVLNPNYDANDSSKGPQYYTAKLPISINVTSSGLGATAATTLQAINLDQSGLTPGYGASYGNNDATKLTTISYEVNQAAGSNEFVEVVNGTILAQGHIAPVADVATNNASRTHGTITIKAYIDSKKVAISDTLAATVNDNNPNTANGTTGRIVVPGLTNGTSADWVAGRVVFTTAQWNSLNATDASFTIKVVANEGSSSDHAVTNAATALTTPVTP